jgi:CheY-like chemotaxis protein
MKEVRIMSVRKTSDMKDLPAMNADEVVDILVVEDNDAERDSIVATLRASIPDVHVVSASNGEEALDFLFARGAYAGRAGEDPPRLILLDLAMPGTDGFSVLGQIRSMEPKDALTVAPVVIFTDSQIAGDVRASYRCGANSYILKPLSFKDFTAVVEAVGQYWMDHNRTTDSVI